MNRLEQRPQAPMIFDAGRALHARRHVNTKRPDARDRVPHVVGRQPAGEHHLTAGRDLRRSGPVDRPTCAAPGCSTKLSIYNLGSTCWQHADLSFPNYRGKRLAPGKA